MTCFFIQNLQSAAENLAREHKYNHTLVLPDIDYVNVNDLKDEVAAAMEDDERLGQDVYKQESGVHIPIEIYEGCELDFFLFLFYGREEGYWHRRFIV